MASGGKKRKSAAEKQREYRARKKAMQQCELYKKHAENQKRCRLNQQRKSQKIIEKEKEKWEYCSSEEKHEIIKEFEEK